LHLIQDPIKVNIFDVDHFDQILLYCLL
jgi:hypothetical protein